MMKRIIIISVAALVSVSLSLGAVFLLPKFLGSVSEIGVKKNDTVSGGRVSRADSTDAEGAAEESADVPSVSQAQQSRVTKNEEPSISSKTPQQSSSASKSVRKENVTKLCRQRKRYAAALTLRKSSFMTAKAARHCRTEFIYRKICKRIRKHLFSFFCTVPGSAGRITSRRFAISKACSTLRAILYRAA